MLKNKTIQKKLSLLLVAVYAFVILFSAKFHHHHLHEFFGGDAQLKVEKGFKSFVEGSSANDCVVCHFVTLKTGFLPIAYSFETLVLKDGQNQKISYVLEDFYSEKILLRLRGPPAFI